MIKFNKNENNKQFISISIEDGTDVIKVFIYLLSILLLRIICTKWTMMRFY